MQVLAGGAAVVHIVVCRCGGHGYLVIGVLGLDIQPGVLAGGALLLAQEGPMLAAQPSLDHAHLHHHPPHMVDQLRAAALTFDMGMAVFDGTRPRGIGHLTDKCPAFF